MKWKNKILFPVQTVHGLHRASYRVKWDQAPRFLLQCQGSSFRLTVHWHGHS